ncbi:MAG: SpoIIE family protein phosphatase, partial [Acidobacteria bacterium]|nr:SpoIIE family protein phosphatase [Acidobacteriota bacterium]
MRISIRTKLILAIGAPLLLVYLVMIWILVDQIQSRGLRRLEERAVELASQPAEAIASRLGLAARSAEDLAALLAGLPEGTPVDTHSLAQSILGRDPLIHGFRLLWFPDSSPSHPLLVGASRRTASSAMTPLPVPAKPDTGRTPAWAEASLQKGVAVWTEPFTDPEEGSASLAAYITLIRRDDKVLGVVRIDFLLETLSRQIGPQVEADYTLVSHGGHFLIPPAGVGTAVDSLLDLARSRGRTDLIAGTGRLLEGKSGLVQAEGLLRAGRRWIVYAPVPQTDWFFIASVPENVVLAFSRGQLHLGLAILVAGLGAILVLVILMASRITRPVARLATAVEGLGKGNLDVQVTGVETHDEIGDLASAFNRMVADLKRHVEALERETAAREKVEGEIRVARQIQTALLPRKLPGGEAFDLHAVNLPARRVAGDFYDCFLRDDKTLVFLIADVSGKGVPAALFMAVARTVLRDVLASGLSLSAAVERANELLEKDSPGSMYITLFVAWYDLATGALR